MEVLRDEEFAPVKNAPGAAKDSPDTAQAAVLALHKRYALSALKDDASTANELWALIMHTGP